MSLINLGPGERTLIRRALVVYAQQWMAEKVKHRKAGDAYNADYDQDRIDACDRIADKLRLSGQPSSVSAAPEEKDPYETLRWAVSALDGLGHDLETGAESKSKIAQRAHQRAQELRQLLVEDTDSSFRRILKGESK